MAQDFLGIRDRINARFEAAHEVARAILPDIVLKKGRQNLVFWTPSSETNYMRVFYNMPASRALSAGDWAVERTYLTLHVEFLIRREVGDDDVMLLASAIRPVFRTGDDGLDFDGPDAPTISDPHLDGEHWIGPVVFPCWCDEI